MKQFNSVLCVVDNANNSDAAIIQSIRLAKAHQSDITFISVIPHTETWRTAFHNKSDHNNYLDESIKARKLEIKKSISRISSSVNANINVYFGIGFIEVIKCVNKNQHDLVVKCAENTAWLDRIFGSDDMHLLRKCPCPVLMLKPGHSDEFKSVLATVDVNNELRTQESEEEHSQGQLKHALNTKVLEYSVTLCMPGLTELHVGSVWEAYAEDFCRYGAFSHIPRKEVDHYVEQTLQECSDRLSMLIKQLDDTVGESTLQYLTPQLHLVKGKPFKELPIMAQKYKTDLIVMGTIGRLGIPGLIIGNTAESILEQTRCSVLAIKPDGFETPVL